MKATKWSTSRDAGISARHLERVFRERVGIEPKTFARIVRFQHVMNAPPENWAALAAGSGYFDQAHLTRSLKLFYGQTPKEIANSG